MDGDCFRFSESVAEDGTASMNIKDTFEYRQGYWDGVNGKQVPWIHLMDNLYLKGHRDGAAFRAPESPQSTWRPF